MVQQMQQGHRLLGGVHDHQMLQQCVRGLVPPVLRGGEEDGVAEVEAEELFRVSGERGGEKKLPKRWPLPAPRRSPHGGGVEAGPPLHGPDLPGAMRVDRLHDPGDPVAVGLLQEPIGLVDD